MGRWVGLGLSPWDSGGVGMAIKKMVWVLVELRRMYRARWQLFWVRVEHLGWRVVKRPVEICPDCGKAFRVLWWDVGDHWKCLPF